MVMSIPAVYEEPPVSKLRLFGPIAAYCMRLSIIGTVVTLFVNTVLVTLLENTFQQANSFQGDLSDWHVVARVVAPLPVILWYEAPFLAPAGVFGGVLVGLISAVLIWFAICLFFVPLNSNNERCFRIAVYSVFIAISIVAASLCTALTFTTADESGLRFSLLILTGWPAIAAARRASRRFADWYWDEYWEPE